MSVYLRSEKKGEVVVLTKNRISTLRRVVMGEMIIDSKPSVKYSGLTLN